MREELEQVYAEHQQALFSLALAITRNREQAEDAVHEAFVRLCASALSPPHELVPYVFSCVRNAAIDQQRRHHGVQLSVESLFQTPELSAGPCGEGSASAGQVSHNSSVLETVQRTESLRLLAEAIDSLDRSTQEIIVLKTWAALTFAAIGEVTGVPAKTVETRYRRGLLQLNALLKEST